MDLELIERIYKITQAGFEAKFISDFEGMIRIDYFEEFNPDFYEHEHVGCPDQSREKLKLGIENSLDKFIARNKLK